MTWRILNLGPAGFQLHAAWLPHDHFYAEERGLHPALSLGAGESAELELAATCADPPGAEIENAYVILRASSNEKQWRVFARLRVKIPEEGPPRITVERVSVQPVGYTANQTT